ncbi:Peroxidase, family 2-domain-containing protein [Aspergillus undulatus]|uniref:Peroxidase, family 2-domain-containing protein n=1 Tax=Aspergillus undulatus TaxID=1810928 RepID=UPI003CCCB767
MKFIIPALGLASLASANLHLDLGLVDIGVGGGHAAAHHYVSASASAGANSNSKAANAWIAAGPSDARSPCPMLNTLANQGFIHRDGRNITREDLAHAFESSINFNPALASAMFDNAIMSNPGGSHFDLDMLNVHNGLEHDASISRSDAYFGNNVVFNPSVFAETKKYWPTAELTLQQLANSKLARQVHSKAFNPTYTYPEAVEETSYNEMGFPVIAFGDMEKGTVNREYVEYFFENERLPTEVGWKVREEPITPEQMGAVAKKVAEAVKLVTGAPKEGQASASGGKQKRGAHSFDF